MAGDPSLYAAVDPEAEAAERDITVSTWFTDAADYKKAMAATDIYVAPRDFEGIGMSFLEAMAMGKCVIAPDNPTMNEYIVHGVNGLLYDVDNPRPLDLSRAAEIGASARQSVVNGYRDWTLDFATRLQDVLFCANLPDQVACQEFGSYVWAGDARVAAAFNPVRGALAVAWPRVTVAVVCYNSGAEIEATLQTILAQTYPEMELVVVDGNSSDATPAILERYRDRIDTLVSEKDRGVYDAMNKAATLGTGDYIIFINAGDFFCLPTSLELAMSNVFGAETGRLADAPWPDFIVGNHVYMHSGGASALHKANDFADTWAQLQSGGMRPGWWSGIPCHQATITRRALLAEKKYDLRFKITADHNFMFTMRQAGASFVHCNSVIATYVGGGMSQQKSQQCIRESFRSAVSRTPRRQQLEAFFIRNFGPYTIVDDPDKLQEDIALVRASGLFFEPWYRLRYMRPDSPYSDPVQHYLLEGHRAGCKPNPFFDGDHYLLRNTDVFEAGLNPLLHYLRYGRDTHRPTYDWDSKDNAMRFARRFYPWHEEELTSLAPRLLACTPAQLLAALDDK